MSKYKMPKDRKRFEDMLVNAFDMGMTCGYGVEHTELAEDESVLRNRFRAMIQGKVEDMSTIYNGEMTTIEKLANR